MKYKLPVAFTIIEFDELLDTVADTDTPSLEDAYAAKEMEEQMLAALTNREKRVFLCLLRGCTEAEIADDEELSIRQVRRLVAEVRRKAAAAIGRVQ